MGFSRIYSDFMGIERKKYSKILMVHSILQCADTAVGSRTPLRNLYRNRNIWFDLLQCLPHDLNNM